MKRWQIIRAGFLIAAMAFAGMAMRAAVVVLNGNQTDYTFQSGNTYYITNVVTISGTATVQQGTVIKYGLSGQLILETLDCQTVSTNPAILTARDDDRFGEMVAGSTHTPSGYYGSGDPFLIYSLSDTQVHDLQFYFLANGLGLINEADNETSITYGLWNLWMEDCDWGIDCENTISSGENILNITNLTMIDCTGGIAGHYNIAGNIVNSTFRNVGGLVSDDYGYFFNPLNFRWCVFTNVGLEAFEVNVWGDHNGFANCGQFSVTDYYYNGNFLGTNAFGDSWYWLSNSVIGFTLSSTNHYINHQVVPVQINLTTNGAVFYQALLVDSTDFESATWNNFTTTNLSVDLGGLTNKVYDIWVGLYGARDYAPVWQKLELEMDTNRPVIRISNPVLTGGAVTSGIPLLQVQGQANENLGALTFDLSNAVCFVTNQQGLVMDRFFDTNKWNFTTNYFQCFDVFLTNGLNLISIHASDLAGNSLTTNLLITIDYSLRTNPPTVDLVFPQDGMLVMGTNFTANGYVDDPTSQIEAQITDAGGQTNYFTGVVERDGRFWVDNLPLSSGTNHLTYTITDAAGNVNVTNIAIIQTNVTLTMSALSDEEMWLPHVSVHGMVSDSSAVVWVNGVQGTNVSGSWSVDNVPLPSGGVAVFNLTVYPPGEAPSPGSGPGGGQNPRSPHAVNQQSAPVKPNIGPTVTNDTQFAELYEHMVITNLDYRFDGIRICRGEQHWAWGTGGGGFATNFDRAIQAGWNGYWIYSTNDWIIGPAYALSSWIGLLSPYDTLASRGPADLGSALIGYEYCDVSTNYPLRINTSFGYMDSYERTYQRKAQTKTMLSIGGRGIPNQQALVDLTGWAHDIANVEAYNESAYGGCTYYPIWLLSSLPYQFIAIGAFGKLAEDGHLDVILPTGMQVDITPRVDGHKFYTAIPNTAIYVPRIIANSHDLSLEKPDFCVGQNLQFDVAGLPDHVYSLVAIWTLPGTFVNTNSDPHCDLFYEKNAAFLKPPQGTSSTHCWYVKAGQSLTASVHVYYRCTPNGKLFDQTITGGFNVHRPTTAKAQPYQPDGTPKAQILNNWLSLGVSGVTNDMSFKHTITTDAFCAGQAGYVQLITDADIVNADPQIASPNGIALDARLGEFPRGTPDVSADGSTNVWFFDAPGIALPSNLQPIYEDISFSTYLMFKPSGGIWVPLRLITWELHDKADPDASSPDRWKAYSSNDHGMTDITDDKDRIDFPHWTTTW